MKLVWLTALGVGGATVLGAGIGFVCKRLFRDPGGPVLGFSTGVMLAAAVLGLIMPSLEQGSVWVTVAGILAGALCLGRMELLMSGLYRLTGVDPPNAEDPEALDSVLLLVAAIAIHKLPEGIAAGVGFGSENSGDALLIAGGIALQNIPEGAVMVAPMLSVGIRPRRTFWITLGTGLMEAVGTLLGYLAVRAAKALLPFALAFAGGTMLYVVGGGLLASTRKGTTYAMLAGFCLMLLCDALLSG